MAKKLTQDEFNSRIESLQTDNFDYTDTVYVNARAKIKVKCKKHNEVFTQLPLSHIKGKIGCSQCYSENMSSVNTRPKEYYIEKIQNSKYKDHIIIDIINGENIILECSNHGKFNTTYTSIKRSKKHICPKCIAENFTKGSKKCTESFKILAKKVHNDSYNYDLSVYETHKTPLEITCNTCNITFLQKPVLHLQGKGCTNCWQERNRSKKINLRTSIKEIEKRCKVFFEDTLDFSKSKQVTSNEKIEVFCKKCQNYFEQYRGHLERGIGCQKCSKEDSESKPEKVIKKLLLANGTNFIQEYTFPDCIYKKKLKFDFYIPEINTCIEYQGQQHYIPISIFGGDKALELQKEKDSIKKQYCKDNEIVLLEIKYDESIEEMLISSNVIKRI